MENPDASPLKRQLLPYVLFAACALLTLVICLKPLTWLTLSFVIDDALYYLRVPLNVAAGHGVTYDRVTFTNGFHPLWAALLLPAAYAVQQDYMLMLRCAILISGAIALAGVWYMRGAARLLGWSAAGCTAGMIALFYPRIDLWMSLMESGPSMLVLMLSIYAGLRYDLLVTRNRTHQFLFGLLMALVFLVRLDQVFIVVAFFVGSLFMRIRAHQNPREWASGLLVSGLFATLLVLPYLIVNWYYFGHPVPVSGQKKHTTIESFGAFLDSMLRSVHVAASKLCVSSTLLIVCLIVGMVVAVWAMRFLKRHHPPACRFALCGVLPWFGVGVIARMLYLRIFIAIEAANVPWYWVPEYIFACFVFGYFIDVGARLVPLHVTRSKPWQIAGYLLCLAIVCGGSWYVAVDAERFHDDRMITIEVARWARQDLPADGLYAMYDSGVFCYFSGFDTISLNGLISDRWTMERSRDRDFRSIVERFDVDYIVQWMYDDAVAAIPPSALIHKSNRKMKEGYHGNKWLCIVDWRIHNPL